MTHPAIDYACRDCGAQPGQYCTSSKTGLAIAIATIRKLFKL